MRSFIMNCWYWAWHMGEIRDARSYKRDTALFLRSESDVEIFLSHFKWVPDEPTHWVPWIITVFARRFKDDCDGATVMALWALTQIGAEGRYISLLGDDGNHAIAYWACKVYSNGKVYRVGSLGDVLSLFQGRYHTMKIRGKW